jgi:hypothetical protein
MSLLSAAWTTYTYTEYIQLIAILGNVSSYKTDWCMALGSKFTVMEVEAAVCSSVLVPVDLVFSSYTCCVVMFFGVFLSLKEVVLVVCVGVHVGLM